MDYGQYIAAYESAYENLDYEDKKDVSFSYPEYEQLWGKFEVSFAKGTNFWDEDIAEQEEEELFKNLEDWEVDWVIFELEKWAAEEDAKHPALIKKLDHQTKEEPSWLRVDIGQVLMDYQNIEDWKTLPGPKKGEYVCPIHGRIKMPHGRRMLLYKNYTTNQIDFLCPICHKNYKSSMQQRAINIQALPGNLTREQRSEAIKAIRAKYPIGKAGKGWQHTDPMFRWRHQNFLGGVLVIRCLGDPKSITEFMEVGKVYTTVSLEKHYSKKTVLKKLRDEMKKGTVKRVGNSEYVRLAMW